MRTIVAALLAIGAMPCLCFGAELNKCRDGAGSVTYSSESCESQGLKSAGPIRDRTTVVPGAAATTAATGGRKQEGESELRGSPVQIKPVNPLIEKLLK